MNVALLLFGQLRWMDNPHTASSHHNHIINRYERVDIFGHFWTPEQTEKLTQSAHVKFEPSPSDPLAMEKIQQKYKFTDIKFSDPIQFDFAKTLYHKAKARVWPDIYQDGWFESSNAFNNVLSQMYAVQGVAKLLDQHMLNNPTIKYDYVVISRPDICIWDYPNFKFLYPGCFHLSNHHGRFPDLGFIYDPKFNIVFSELFNNTVNITDEELYSLWEPNAEALKFNSYRKYFGYDLMRPIPLPVRIVRGQDCRGTQW